MSAVLLLSTPPSLSCSVARESSGVLLFFVQSLGLSPSAPIACKTQLVAKLLPKPPSVFCCVRRYVSALISVSCTPLTFRYGTNAWIPAAVKSTLPSHEPFAFCSCTRYATTCCTTSSVTPYPACVSTTRPKISSFTRAGSPIWRPPYRASIASM